MSEKSTKQRMAEWIRHSDCDNCKVCAFLSNATNAMQQTRTMNQTSKTALTVSSIILRA